MSIRFKVILPYLILTLVVALTGAYVVTKLVTSTLTERLTNQLLEAGRVVLDEFARLEIRHINEARFIAYTSGMGEALLDGDEITIKELARPAFGGMDLQYLIITDLQGREVIHLRKQDDGTLSDVVVQQDASYNSIVQTVLADNFPESLPQRTIGAHPIDGHYYYFTAIPLPFGEQTVGVVVVGTSLDKLVPTLKNIALADVIIYGEQGQALASTLAGGESGSENLSEFSISEEMFLEALYADEYVEGANIEVADRWYSLARGPIRVGADRLGVFAVILPADFVVESGSTNRNTYVALFSLAMVMVVLIGYFISRLIINPLSSLVNTSRAIAGGDLAQRTGIRTSDEIGVLANTFDDMTGKLEHRTLELERTNRILEQMDRTKMQFIHISAHELRTPLTLIQGYTQMIQFKSGNDPEMIKYATGILEGSRRMVEVIDSMLDVSRIDNNELNVTPSEIEIHPLIEKVRKTFDNSLVERKLKFITDDLDQLPSFNGDPDLLYKVFYHLVMNAIKYTPNGGTITVRGRTVAEPPNPPEIEVAVQDTGIGIDPQYHELIFEKFFQTGEVLFHSSGKTKFKGGGPGLGLAIARGIVLAHHGRIWVESPGHDEEKNPGSTFYVCLPLNGMGA